MRDDRRGNSVRLIVSALAVEARREQRELGRIGDGEACFERLEPCQASPGASAQ